MGPHRIEPGQLCSFISKVARNGLVDHICVTESKRGFAVPGGGLTDRPPGHAATTGEDESPEAGVHRAQFARALRDCVLLLRPRARVVWFLRVFYDMKTKEIARHPRVRMSVTNVDVTLTRCRKQIRSCMKAKDFYAADMPRGSFATLWEAFRHQLWSSEPVSHG